MIGAANRKLGSTVPLAYEAYVNIRQRLSDVSRCPDTRSRCSASARNHARSSPHRTFLVPWGLLIGLTPCDVSLVQIPRLSTQVWPLEAFSVDIGPDLVLVVPVLGRRLGDTGR